MVLFKRYFRSIRENASLYISTILLTILSLMLFFLYYIAGSGIIEYKDSFFKSQRLEDACFTTYLEIEGSDIEKLESDYDVVIEKQEYINIESNGLRFRVFNRANKVKIESVVEGRGIENDNELLISRAMQ